MVRFAGAIAAVVVLAGTGVTAAAAVGGAADASVGALPKGGELITVAAAAARGGVHGGGADSGAARHGGGARGGEAGSHGHRGNAHHGGDHGRHYGQHRGHHGGHYFAPRFGFGLALGAPFWWGHGYYDYPYYAPYSFARPYTTFYAEPAVIRYVERDPGYRYYCTEPAGFYPEVQTCPKAWLKVIPDGAASTSPPPGYTAPPGRQ